MQSTLKMIESTHERSLEGPKDWVIKKEERSVF